jgi:hypothetical protein
MLTTKALWRDYYEFTGRASDICRTLLLSALAAIWILKGGEDANVQLTDTLLVAIVVVAIGLTCDLSQYLVSARNLRRFARARELEGVDPDEPRSLPGNHTRLADSLYRAKIAAVFTAYLFVAVDAFSRLHIV